MYCSNTAAAESGAPAGGICCGGWPLSSRCHSPSRTAMLRICHAANAAEAICSQYAASRLLSAARRVAGGRKWSRLYP